MEIDRAQSPISNLPIYKLFLDDDLLFLSAHYPVDYLKLQPMQTTLIDLPPPIEKAITNILAQQDAAAWIERARTLHLRYTQQA